MVEATNMRARAVVLAVAIGLAPLGVRAAAAEIRIAVAGPITGPMAWGGEQFERGAGMAVADLNAKGGVLGQNVELIVGDDFCDPEQAVALARKLVSDGVVFVAGHLCSHSSIAAAKVYEEAKTLTINPGSSAAKLTDEGGPNVFRVNGRDDQQGAMLGDYLAEHWADKEIAILDDGTAWGAGVANAVRRRLRERGVSVTVDETFTPGEAEYSALVSKMQAAGVDVFLPGTLQREMGLIFRQARERGYDLQLVSTSAGHYESFPLIAGPGLEGTVMVANADMRASPEAAEVVAKFHAQDYEPIGTHAQRRRRGSGLGPGGRGRGLARARCGDRGPAQPAVRHGAGPDRIRREGRCHGFQTLAMVRLAGGQHLRAAGAKA